MEKILVENSWWKIEGDRVVLEIDESKLYSVRGMTWIAGVLVPALFAVNNDSTELDMAPDNLDHE